MLHHLLVVWFDFVRDWNYLGVFLLMALESSVVPIPSEIIMPPAAYWASQGRMNFWLVIAVGTCGSYFGSLLSYWVARVVGSPVVSRYGKYFLLSEDKLALSEAWVTRYGAGGVFFSRLLPVVRHLISIPAGVLRMNFTKFSLSTVLGAGLWCGILAWFGRVVIGDRPDLLSSPEALVAALQAKLHLVIAAVMVFALAYAFVLYLRKKQPTPAANAL